LTLRHFPQSFEVSSLGGWIATRAGGHFATGPTHIDDLVESLRVVTPAGVVETRRLPASGAGPSPDRLFLGSEGTLGVVTEAWARVRPRPRYRAGGPVRFASFADGAAAVRALAQSGLAPSNCRLLDPLEALVNGAGDGSSAMLIVGFESADHPLGPWAARAAELVADHGGVLDGGGFASAQLGDEREAGSGGAAETWRSSFLRGPYLRDALVRLGALCETFETACTWDRFAELHRTVLDAVAAGLAEAGAASGFVTCRLTHAYPDGAAPYFTVVAPARRGSELAQWDTVKAAASEALLRAGGTITHHHAVGRDHRPWYDRQRPDLFAEALTAAKARLDPTGVCNPGVLVDPPRRSSERPGP
jgi:alkyldihydroxyacetonephosphate synthase